MNFRPLLRPAIGALIAIACTTTMDAMGLTAFSALPLLPLLILFALIERFPPRSMGFTWGRWGYHALAVIYPIVVMGVLVVLAFAAGALEASQTDWVKAWSRVGLLAASTFLVAILTEEGFFRGWMWASLEKAGQPPVRILIWTSIAFSLWHLSWVVLDTGFDLPAAQVPAFLLNAAVIGAVWGLMRWRSGSVIVSSLSHGVWNGLAYILFGFGTKVGALGIQQTAVYGPEVGLLGLGLNLAFLAVLLRWKARSPETAAPVYSR